MKKIFITLLLTVMIMVGGVGVASAQTQTSETTLDTLLAQIQSLLAQIDSLQQQVEGMRQEQGELRSELSAVRKEFRTFLEIGTEGVDVTTLQELLSEDPTIYPEGLITGYYGPLTFKAVKNFQKKYGIEQAGVVGPKTRFKLNELYAGKSGKTPPGLAKKWEGSNSDDDDDGDDDSDDDSDDSDDSDDNNYSKHPYFDGKKAYMCHKGNTISISIAALNAHLNHGDVLGRCGDDDSDDDSDDDGDDDNATTTDEIAPVISDITESALTDTAVDISWTTDELATSKVTYNKAGDSLEISDTSTSMATGHMISVTGLVPETDYEYVVESSDGSGNVATSSLQTFTTLAVPDTTAPVMSDIEATSTASTSAIVSWTTDEDSDSTLWYGTSTPLTLSSPTMVASSTALVASHAIAIGSLASSTMYYYVVESTDISNNSATSSEFSFTTLSE